MGIESLQGRLEAWAQRLQNVTVSPLTRDYPDNQKTEFTKTAIEAYESLKLSDAAHSAVQRPDGSSRPGFIIFLTAFVVLVARLTGDEDIAIATSSADDGRPFILRVPFDPAETFSQLHAKVEKVVLHSCDASPGLRVASV